jgi:acyl-[acyl-carrier-protein]-phospholipid O-acyltransferase/long-chain-fatty-acid--[acyl-carrier-protein] ligase
MDDTAALLRTRRFLPLLATQTLGAINDNLYKNALVVLALFSAAQAGPILVAVAGGLFILPYALFSATAGQLADRFDKARLIRIVKAAEIAIMATAAAGFMLGSIPLLMAVLFCLGIQATFFSPLKYGILPDHLEERELVAGNGLIEAGTFLGILVGTIAGGALIALPSGAAIVSGLGLAVAAAGFIVACRVPPARPAAPDLRIGWNVWHDTRELLTIAKGNRPVWLSILGLSWFWTVGATLLSEFPVVAKQDLLADSQVVTYLLTVFAIGVGTGSIAIARILKGEVTARHVPFAAFGISLFTWDFATTCMAVQGGLPTVMDLLSSVRGWRMSADLFLLAACGGIYSVPLYAIIQDKSDSASRSRMIACNNVMNAAFMVAGAGCAAALAAVGVSVPRVLVILAAANLAAAIWIVRIIPQDTMRSVLRWYFLTFHDAKITGIENADAAGDRTVVVVNHLSLLDGAFIAAFLPGYPVFAIDTDQAKRLWFLKYFIEIFPVDPANPMSTKSMVKAVREGRRLVIFPEGRLTLTGALMKIYGGPGTIADKAGAVILPVRIDGLEFHRTSRMGGKLRQRWFPKFAMRILPPTTLAVPEDLRGRARRQFVGKVIEDVMTYAAFRPERANRTLFAALLDASARYDREVPVIADAQRNELGYSRIVLGAVILGRKLSGLVGRGEPVGLMLPNSAGAVVAFFALQSRGFVPAMMNLSTGADSMISSCAAARVTVIVSSREFVRRAKLDKLVDAVEKHVRFVWLEDVRKTIGLTDKLAGKLACLFPGRLPGV